VRAVFGEEESTQITEKPFPVGDHGGQAEDVFSFLVMKRSAFGVKKDNAPSWRGFPAYYLH